MRVSKTLITQRLMTEIFPVYENNQNNNHKSDNDVYRNEEYLSGLKGQNHNNLKVRDRSLDFVALFGTPLEDEVFGYWYIDRYIYILYVIRAIKVISTLY